MYSSWYHGKVYKMSESPILLRSHVIVNLTVDYLERGALWECGTRGELVVPECEALQVLERGKALGCFRQRVGRQVEQGQIVCAADAVKRIEGTRGTINFHVKYNATMIILSGIRQIRYHSLRLFAGIPQNLT